jgi:mannose-6-phosphate isomerase-like protein (cupin superfamily)
MLSGKVLEKHEEYRIPVGEWHQLMNPWEVPLRIVEIQYGESCVEEDIERK